MTMTRSQSLVRQINRCPCSGGIGLYGDLLVVAEDLGGIESTCWRLVSSLPLDAAADRPWPLRFADLTRPFRKTESIECGR